MNAPLELCNTLIILVTVVGSVLGFRNRAFEERWIFHPQSILASKEYYRLVTAAFLHADWQHLLLNMLSLYLFGSTVELFVGKTHFLLIYFGAVVGGNLLSLYVHRHHDYLAYGASGGVCGIIFAHILLLPGLGIYMFPLPVTVPGWLYAIGFLVGSFYALRAAKDNIGHDAHLGGAIVGLLLTAGLYPWAVRAHWELFFTILAVAVALLVYLWRNPLFLPITAFFGRRLGGKTRRSDVPKRKQEALQVDAILEKIAKGGMESLTAQEKALLDEVSGKYRRHEDSKKPESDLIL